MRRFTLTLPVLPLLLVLAACAGNPKPYDGVDYGATSQLRLNIGTVLVDSSFTPTGELPNVEHQLTPQPEDVLRTAIRQHYQAARNGATGALQLRFTIRDASVTEQALPVPTGWWAQQTNTKPEFRYSGRLEVESKTEGASRRSGYVHAEATRTMEVGRATPAARARLVNGMVEQMVDDVMQQLDEQMNSNMGGIILSGEDFTITPQPSGRWDKVASWN